MKIAQKITDVPPLPQWERVGGEGEHTISTPTSILPVKGEDNIGTF